MNIQFELQLIGWKKYSLEYCGKGEIDHCKQYLLIPEYFQKKVWCKFREKMAAAIFVC